jgi:hypothetical protein
VSDARTVPLITRLLTPLSSPLVESLAKRLAQGRAEQNRGRQLALESLLQRYSNSKASVEQSHSLEKLKLERSAAVSQKARENRKARGKQ